MTIVAEASDELGSERQAVMGQTTGKRERRSAEKRPDGLEAPIAGRGTVGGWTGGGGKYDGIDLGEERVEQRAEPSAESTSMQECTGGDELTDFGR